MMGAPKVGAATTTVSAVQLMPFHCVATSDVLPPVSRTNQSVTMRPSVVVAKLILESYPSVVATIDGVDQTPLSNTEYITSASARAACNSASVVVSPSPSVDEWDQTAIRRPSPSRENCKSRLNPTLSGIATGVVQTVPLNSETIIWLPIEVPNGSTSLIHAPETMPLLSVTISIGLSCKRSEPTSDKMLVPP